MIDLGLYTGNVLLQKDSDRQVIVNSLNIIELSPITQSIQVCNNRFYLLAYKKLGSIESFTFEDSYFNVKLQFSSLADTLYSVYGVDKYFTVYEGIYSTEEIKNLLLSIEDLLQL